ncbi:MAG: hypothetical protein EPO12_07165 [Aquabacterium sp.]|nr:MAG: hypothetical protein EPO12_07165 [Aquabacterium sp.]
MKQVRLGFDFFRVDAADSDILMQCEAVSPLQPFSYGIPTSRARARRAVDLISVAQSRLVFELVRQVLGVMAGFEIERALLGEAYGPDDERPRWWERLSRGTLRIGPALRRQDPETLRWLELVRQCTDEVDRVLCHPFWELCDPAPKDAGWLLDQEATLREWAVPVTEPCGPSVAEAKQLRLAVQCWHQADLLAACTALAYLSHLARTFADPISYAVAQCAWAEAWNESEQWHMPGRRRSDLLLLLWDLFGRIWLRKPTGSGWGKVHEIVRETGGHVDFMTTKTWRELDLMDYLVPSTA